MKSYCLLAALSISVSDLSSLADTVKGREGAARKDRAALTDDAGWIYDDYQRGSA